MQQETNDAALKSLDPAIPRTLRGRLHVLACPTCHGSLVQHPDSLRCERCRADYPIRDGKIYFIMPVVHKTKTGELKHRLRQMLGVHYKQAVWLLGPGYPQKSVKVLLANIDPASNAVVDLGSGTERLHPDVITLDLFDYPEVDIVCDLQALPFGQEAIDAFITTSVLEHVADTPRLVDKMYFCTRTGGIGIHFFPFLFPFHEAPGDFVRYTHMGARALFRKWNVRRLFNTAGPITLFNTTATEFFSTLFSCGSDRAKELLYLALCAFVCPFKYLDIFFLNNDRFLSTSAMICIVVEKPAIQEAT